MMSLRRTLTVGGQGKQFLKEILRSKFQPPAAQLKLEQRLFSATSQICADGLKYSDKHEWVSMSGNVGTVGISNYAQDALGGIVYAQLPDVDSEFSKDEECGALESVKAASEVYCPVSGRITEKNEAVENEPALINESPEEKGWLFKIELKDSSELDSLMDQENYQKFLKSIAEDDDQ